MHGPYVQHYGKITIVMRDPNQWLRPLHMDTQLFKQLAFKRLKAGFVGTTLAPREFPAPPLVNKRGATRQEYLAIAIKNSRRRDIEVALGR